jgi:hypothetical protein
MIEIKEDVEEEIQIGDFIINLSLNNDKDLQISFARNQNLDKDNPDAHDSPDGAFEDFTFSRKNIHNYE